MIKILYTVALLLAFAGHTYALELKEIKSSDHLARLIYQMIKDDVSANKLLKGIESSETLKIPSYEIEIPVREVFGTIVSERFYNKLNNRLFERNKKYDVREICAFVDAKDEAWRYQIIVFDERQYKLMKQFLEDLLKNEEQK
jgi:hypothetical protein